MAYFYLHPAGRAVVFRYAGKAGHCVPPPEFKPLSCETCLGCDPLGAEPQNSCYADLDCWIAVYTNRKGRSTIIPYICIGGTAREAWTELIHHAQGCSLRNVPVFESNIAGLAAADAHLANSVTDSLCALIAACRRQRTLWLPDELYLCIRDEFLLL
jgi:hypothetical protein